MLILVVPTKKSTIMSFWNFLSNNTNSQEKKYMRQLFSIASADGNLDDTEMEYIISIGKRLDFSEEEIQELKNDLSSKQAKPTLPNNKEGKFFMLFSLINLILADDEVHPKELEITENMVMKLGYDPDTVDTILETIRYNKSNGITPEETYQYLKKHLA